MKQEDEAAKKKAADDAKKKAADDAKKKAADDAKKKAAKDSAKKTQEQEVRRTNLHECAVVDHGVGTAGSGGWLHRDRRIFVVVAPRAETFLALVRVVAHYVACCTWLAATSLHAHASHRCNTCVVTGAFHMPF
jgi:hypothetical protein